MPDETYRIIYEGVPDKANRGIDSLLAKLRALDAQVDRTNAKIRTLGNDRAGLTKYIAALVKLDDELKSKVVDSAAAEKALAGVGRGNKSVAGLTKKLAALEKQLRAVTAAGGPAKAAAAGVGAGSTIGTGGGGGGGGGTGGIVGTGLGRAVGAGLAFAAFRKAVSAAGSSVADRRQYFSESAEMAGHYRKDLGELAVLKGKNAADEDLIRSDLAFQQKTLFNPDDSRTFRLEFGGAIAPSLKARDKQGNPRITPKVADELEVEAARFSARYGLDAQTGGRMAGLLGVTQKIPDARTGAGIMAETMEQLNVEGVGPVKDMAKHMFALSGGMLDPQEDENGEKGGGGRFPSYPAMAARFAAATVATVGKADVAKTKIRQADRLLRKFDGDKNGNEKFLRAQGITPDDDFETAMRKIAPAVLAKGGDQKLKDAGFGNSAERLAVIELAKLNGIVDASLADPAKKDKAARVVQDNDAYARSQAGRQQAAENGEFASRIEQGLAGERLRTARAEARAKMTREDTLKSGPAGRLAEMAISATTFGGISGEDVRVDSQAINSLQDRGERAGVDVLGSHPKLDLGPRMMGFQDEKQLAQEFSAAAREVEAAEHARAAAASLNKMAKVMGKADRPAPPQPGNGGAGVNPGRR